MTRHLCGMGIVWGLLAVTTLTFGQVPAISDATGAAAKALTAEQKTEVDKFWSYQANLMLGTREPEIIVASRRAITAAYAKGVGAGFRAYMAESAAPNFGKTVFQSKRAMTLVNAAIAVSVCQRPEASGVLEQMMGHPNAGVRYWGARGFVTIRGAMLDAGKAEADKLVKMLTDRVDAETSPVIVGLLFEILDFSAGKSPSKAALGTSMTLMTKGVARHLQALRDGDAGAAYAHIGAVKASGPMAGYATADQRTALLKALGEILANGGMAYVELLEADVASRTKTPNPTLKPMAALLVQCEASMARMVGTGAVPVSDALSSSVTTRARKLRDAVNVWIGTPAAPGALSHAKVPTIIPLRRTPPKGAEPIPTPAPDPASVAVPVAAPTPVPAAP